MATNRVQAWTGLRRTTAAIGVLSVIFCLATLIAYGILQTPSIRKDTYPDNFFSYPRDSDDDDETQIRGVFRDLLETVFMIIQKCLSFFKNFILLLIDCK